MLGNNQYPKESRINRELALKNNDKFYEGSPCSKCNKTKRYTSIQTCVNCVENRNSNKDWLEYSHNCKLKSIYGITIEDYYLLLKKQKNVCKVCKQQETRKYKRGIRRLSVDHNHKTNKIRGLLCASCNLMIGQIEKNKFIKKMFEYIEKDGNIK